jgi:peptidoglycan hydrolase CwlO-like protein
VEVQSLGRRGHEVIKQYNGLHARFVNEEVKVQRLNNQVWQLEETARRFAEKEDAYKEEITALKKELSNQKDERHKAEIAALQEELAKENGNQGRVSTLFQ